MGHEYVELKNIHAAIVCYRKAVGSIIFIFQVLIHVKDINPRDHRAWNGLGQAYELLQMYNFALYYYQQAVALRYIFSSLKFIPVDLTIRVFGRRLGIATSLGVEIMMPSDVTFEPTQLQTFQLMQHYD